MEEIKKYIPYILILSLLLMFLMSISNKSRKTKICVIDSISVRRNYDITPELIYTYHTNCGSISILNKLYEIGDSIKVNTILINE